ncbi:MAG: glycosyltransferase family 4 protein [Phycisphaerae bacterium]|nr:glycosyltransferase family 4 protein [Phycisphaerae bacterium]
MTAEAVQPIRVCFIMLKAYPLFNQETESLFGGAEVDFYNLSTELAKDKNYRISFITADYGQKPIEVREGVTIIKSLDFSGNLAMPSLRLWRALRTADAQIYIRELCSAVTTGVALFCKCYGRRFVYRTASTVECDGTYLRENYLRGKAFVWSLRHADAVLAQNETDANNLSAITNAPVQVIKNAHRLLPLQQQPQDKILWVGRSATVKRPELFLELAKQLPQMQFTMICQRADNERQYDKLVTAAKKIKNLEFIPRISFHKIHEYFQRAKVFVNTSNYEGFPNTFIQACKSATAILSLNVNPDSFLDKHNCGISCNGDWQLLVDSLRSLLEEDRCVKMGVNGKKYVEEYHDVTKIVRQYKELFEKLVKCNLTTPVDKPCVPQSR